MKPHHQISYIEMPCRDLAATKEFFSSVFGWSFSDYGPEYSSFRNDSVNGGFYKSDQGFTVATGGVLVVMYSDDLEKTLAEVQQAGGIISKPVFTFPGGRRFHFTDPGGNEFAVWST